MTSAPATLGRLWALMLTMFAVGVGNLAWMAALTGVMVIEKTMPWGRRLAPIVGALLIAWGLAIGYQLSAIDYRLWAFG